MGYIFSPSCDCGYTKDSIRVGGGMFNFRTYDPFPHYCPKCKILFEGNLANAEPVCCDQCGSDDVLPYFDEKICKHIPMQQVNKKVKRKKSLLQRIFGVFKYGKGIEENKIVEDTPPKRDHSSSFPLEGKKCLCPACGEYTLEFGMPGLYD